MRHKRNTCPVPRHVSAYSVTRHYGGAEEGGWWYNWYERLETSPRVPTRKLAHYERRFQAKYGHLGHGNIYSVRGGEKIVVCLERVPGEMTSRHRPHYE